MREAEHLVMSLIDGFLAIGLVWWYAAVFNPSLDSSAVWFIALIAAWLNSNKRSIV